MITPQKFPFTKYEGRLFRAERKENIIVIEQKRELVPDNLMTTFVLPVKNLFEFKQLVDSLFENELGTSEKE